jgi:hypothetical protein
MRLIITGAESDWQYGYFRLSITSPIQLKVKGVLFMIANIIYRNELIE